MAPEGAPVAVRQREPLRFPRHHQPEDRKRLGNGGQHLFGADSLAGHRVAICTEGEMDTLLLAQEVGDLVAVVTLGSCSKGLDRRVIPHMLHVAPILVCYDSDAAGQQGSERLAALSQRIRPIHVPAGKDIGEARDMHVDLRAWVIQELRVVGIEPAKAEPSLPSAEELQHLVDAFIQGLMAGSTPETVRLAGVEAAPGRCLYCGTRPLSKPYSGRCTWCAQALFLAIGQAARLGWSSPSSPAPSRAVGASSPWPLSIVR